MSVNSSERSQSSWQVRGLDSNTRETSHQQPNSMLVGRRLEVYNKGEWMNGLVTKEIQDEAGGGNLKWQVNLDNNESLCFDNLRGNSLVRFLGNNSVVRSKHAVKEDPDSPIDSPVNMIYEAYGRRKGMGPRFLETTESSTQPNFTNFEVERIREAFRSGNFHSMKKLPVSISSDQMVTQEASSWTLRNRLESGRPLPVHRSLKKSGLFHDYGYMSSPHELQLLQRTQERKAGEWKRASIAGGTDHEGKPYSSAFLTGSVAASRRMKHEGNFPGSDEGYFPYMSHDVEESDTLAREKQKRDSLSIHRKGFAHTGARFGGQGGATGGGLSERPTRKLLPELLKEIHTTLVDDWSKSNFTVCADGDDVVYLKFEISTVDSVPALLEYMKTSTTDNSSVLPTSHWYKKYHVRKVVELWGTRGEAGYISFALRPPWVKATAASSYQSLHPDTATYASSSKGGTSLSSKKTTVPYGPTLLRRQSSRSTQSIKRNDSMFDDISSLGL